MAAAHTALVDQLAEIDLADTTRPGGVAARVQEVSAIIRADLEAYAEGRLADVLPITTDTENRSVAA
ncbi:hypothetical protein [Nocardiopsis sp. L17-MgMaSL7]|uniref:hypothetical protein n=1 Tax=Nocardiopsis sp. L17-MgMaSL7 TaxID=1938893 RepID=UPI000D712F90|nr:hypothetical protein [Nocardiopsis sp. L17-MgMaSL7]PWV44550.1 hypothetical protein BDW27_1239 [Nocardiopsis sp. L17-MgMaSL7]